MNSLTINLHTAQTQPWCCNLLQCGGWVGLGYGYVVGVHLKFAFNLSWWTEGGGTWGWGWGSIYLKFAVFQVFAQPSFHWPLNHSLLNLLFLVIFVITHAGRYFQLFIYLVGLWLWAGRIFSLLEITFPDKGRSQGLSNKMMGEGDGWYATTLYQDCYIVHCSHNSQHLTILCHNTPPSLLQHHSIPHHTLYQTYYTVAHMY